MGPPTGRAHDGAMTERQSHPHFDDGGTLDWYTELDDALAAAAAAGKRVLIEFGREM